MFIKSRKYVMVLRVIKIISNTLIKHNNILATCASVGTEINIFFNAVNYPAKDPETRFLVIS